MIERLLRERRRRNIRKAKLSWKKRQSAMERKRKLEEQLEITKKVIEPDVYVPMSHGIYIGVHVCRTQYGKPDFRFEAYRKDAQRGYVSTFSLGDLDALEKAVADTKRWAKEQK